MPPGNGQKRDVATENAGPYVADFSASLAVAMTTFMRCRCVRRLLVSTDRFRFNAVVTSWSAVIDFGDFRIFLIPCFSLRFPGGSFSRRAGTTDLKLTRMFSGHTVHRAVFSTVRRIDWYLRSGCGLGRLTSSTRRGGLKSVSPTTRGGRPR